MEEGATSQGVQVASRNERARNRFSPGASGRSYPCHTLLLAP